MGNVGLKISNPGYDANKAAGYQLLFNSSWPSIAVAYESSQTIPYVSATTATFTHNLGFAPFTVAWVSYPDGTNFSDTSDMALGIYKNTVSVTYTERATTVGTDLYGRSASGNVTLYVKCYNIDLSKAANYPFMQVPTYRQPYSPNVGIKVAKENRSIDSKDLRDFIVHSRGQSPTVLSVLTEASAVPSVVLPGSGTTDIIFTNPQNYVPWIYGFAHQTDGSGNLYYANVNVGGPAATTYPSVTIVGSTVTLNLPTQVSVPGLVGGTLLILRDPMFAANAVNVTV